MRLKITCLALLVSVAACLGMAAVATAASSPTATATKATAVTNTSAKLNATINPNGAATTYVFSYGPTTSLGINTTPKTTGDGTKNVSVSATLSSLPSGTTYYYAVTATNAAGTSTTKTVSFKTTGHAPVQAVTGGAAVLSSTSAAFTGSINTQGVNTNYYFEYGTTPNYGSQTPVQIATGNVNAEAESYTVTGLTPGATYYFQLIAANGSTDVSNGGQQSFVTWPTVAPAAKLVQYTTPRTILHGPYVLSTIGKISDPTLAVPAGELCTGEAVASYYYGKRLIYKTNMPIAPNCFFSTKTEFKTLPIKGLKSEKISVYVRYDGSHYLKGTILKPQTVTLG